MKGKRKEITFGPLIIAESKDSEYDPTEDELLDQFAQIITDIYWAEESKSVSEKEPEQMSLF